MLPYDNISAKKAERAELEENNIYEVTHFGDLVSMDLLATRTLALPWETWAKFYLVIRLPSRSVLPQTVCLARSYRETPQNHATSARFTPQTFILLHIVEGEIT